MSQYCEAHKERTGAEIPVYRLGLCRDCYDGKPIDAAVERSGYSVIETSSDRALRRYVEKHREHYLQAMRQRYYLRRDRVLAKAQCQ